MRYNGLKATFQGGHNMKIGVCATSAKAAIVKELGYDYIEENLSAIQK